MKNIIFVLFVLSSLSSYGKSLREESYKSLTQANFDWYQSKSLEINDILQNGEGVDVIPVINTLCEIWKFRDGAVGAEIAPAIAQSFIHRPHLTFLWFDKHSQAFDDWIFRMPEALLTDYEGTYSDRLKALKTDLLVALNAYLSSSNSDKFEPLVNKFIDKLKATEVSIID